MRYREGIEISMRLGLDKPISNIEPAHVVVLFELFFKHARDHVRIFSARLRNAIFSDPALLREAECALRRGVRISVLHQALVPDDCPFLDLLMKAGMHVSCVTPQAEADMEMNFVVMDTRSIRIERDRANCEAQARMHAPKMAASLSRYFDSLVSKRTTGRVNCHSHTA